MGGVLDTGTVSANEAGDKIAGGEKDPNYKATSEVEIVGFRAQRNLNLYGTKEDLDRINNKDNNNTTIAWQGKYTKDNPNGLKATEGESAQFSFTVNPWPNENDMLKVIKLTGKHDQKVFVQGQTFTTGVKVENLDANARERLVGQVYNPLTGEVVEGARAYIDENDNVIVKMPDGTINEDGSINEDSIFYKDPSYKALQNLEVKFFARPRTKGEFEAIVKSNEAGFYTGTGAGTTIITHKGQKVEVDLQGIDRYDHYNLIGGFKLNLDDTRYYDQGFIDGNKDDTSKHTSSKVKPGEEFDVNLYVPEDKKDRDVFPNQKTPEEMEAAKKGNEAVGTIDWQFINKINEGKKPEDQWKLEYDESTLPTTFKITPPKSAKAGEFVAVPLTYTYTNGSTDVHWFHFVVQESTNNKPEYLVKVDYPTAEQKSPAKVPEDDKKLPPISYSIPEGTKFKDDKGNEWTVSIDETTGEVTAQPKNPLDFKGGEKLQVPVISHYQDPNEPDKDITEETIAEFVIKDKTNTPPDYSAKVGKAGEELSSSATINKDEDDYNRTPNSYSLPDTVLTDDDGNRYVEDENGYKWIVNINPETGEVKATVPYGEDVNYAKLRGTIINVPVEAHYINQNGDDAGTEQTSVQFVATGEDLNHIQYDAKKGKAGDTLESDVILDQNEYERKPVKYTIDQTEYEDEKGNKWIISIDEKTGQVTAKVPNAAEGETINLDGTMINVPVTAHYADENGKEIGTKKANVQFLGSGTEGTHQYTEKIPFDTKVEVVDDLKPGEWRYKKDENGNELKGELGSKKIEWTIKDSVVQKDPKVTEKAPVDAVIEIGNGTIELDPVEKVVEKPFNTEYIYDENMEVGKEEEVTPGKNGKTTITTSYDKENNKLVTTEKTEDPTNRVVRIGIKPIETEEPIPHNTKYKYNPELKVGEIKKIKDGTPGKVIVTTTFNKETGKLETKVTRIEPIDAEYEYGSKTEGKVIVESDIPYEVEIIEDDTMDAGTHEVVQEGEVGKKETTIVIENSEEKSRSDKVTKEAKKKIIKVGTKPNENMCPIPGEDPKPEDPTDPEKPGEDDPKDPEKPGDKDPENPEKPGDKDPENPEKPGKEDPTDPEKPGEENPKDPEKPGQEEPGTPDKPEEPGERPEIPERPETPENPEVPETPEKPQTPNEEKPETPETPDVKEEPESPEKPNMPNTVAKKSTNPKTGIGSIAPIFTSMGISIAGLMATKKKKKEDEE